MIACNNVHSHCGKLLNSHDLRQSEDLGVFCLQWHNLITDVMKLNELKCIMGSHANHRYLNVSLR